MAELAFIEFSGLGHENLKRL